MVALFSLPNCPIDFRVDILGAVGIDPIFPFCGSDYVPDELA